MRVYVYDLSEGDVGAVPPSGRGGPIGEQHVRITLTVDAPQPTEPLRPGWWTFPSLCDCLGGREGEKKKEACGSEEPPGSSGGAMPTRQPRRFRERHRAEQPIEAICASPGLNSSTDAPNTTQQEFESTDPLSIVWST